MNLVQQTTASLQRKAPHLFPTYTTVKLTDRVAQARWDDAKPARHAPQVFALLGLSMLGTEQLRVAAFGAILSSPDRPLVLSRPGAALTCITITVANALAIFQSVRNARVYCAADARRIQDVIQDNHVAGSVAIVAEDLGADCALARQAAQATGAGIVTFNGIEDPSPLGAIKQWGQQAQRRIERAVLACANVI